jgi:hypothetical protein
VDPIHRVPYVAAVAAPRVVAFEGPTGGHPTRQRRGTGAACTALALSDTPSGCRPRNSTRRCGNCGWVSRVYRRCRRPGSRCARCAPPPRRSCRAQSSMAPGALTCRQRTPSVVVHRSR